MAPLFDSQLTWNVLIVFGGTNDLGGGHASAETVGLSEEALVRTYIQDRGLPRRRAKPKRARS